MDMSLDSQIFLLRRRLKSCVSSGCIIIMLLNYSNKRGNVFEIKTERSLLVTLTSRNRSVVCLKPTFSFLLLLLVFKHQKS